MVSPAESAVSSISALSEAISDEIEEAARTAQALARLGMSMEELRCIAEGEIPS